MKTKIYSLLILSVLLISSVQSYQFELPDYDKLIQMNLITPSYQLNLNINTDRFYQNEADNNKMDQLIEATQLQLFGLVYEMFIFPYRLYSYLDQNNKKQYLFSKIDFQQFHSSQEKNQNSPIKNQKTTNSSIFDIQINLKQCILQSPNSCHIQVKNNQVENHFDCFEQSHLFSFLPQLLTIHQEQHQQVQIQKINDQYLLIKNRAIPNSKHSLPFYEKFELYLMNIHSYLFVARYNFLIYISEQKSIQNNDQQSQNKSILGTQKQKDIEQQMVKINQIVKNQIEITKFIFEKNHNILSNLFTLQQTTTIDKEANYDYIASNNSFYFIESITKKCPFSNNQVKLDFSLNEKIVVNNQQNCTYLKLHEKKFAKNKNEQPAEYISKNQVVSNVSQINLWLNRDQNIVINLLTKKREISIDNKISIKSQCLHEQPLQTIFQGTHKLSIFEKRGEVFEIIEKKKDKILELKCKFQITPHLLYAQEINSEHFVICVEGSVCTIYNFKCQTINRLQFDNAYGLAWKYKLDYHQNQVISYFEVSKISDRIIKRIKAPVQMSQINKTTLNSGDKILQISVIHKDNFSYAIKKKILFSELSSSFDRQLKKLNVQFFYRQRTLQFAYLRPSLFKDFIYQSAELFQQRFIEYSLNNLLFQFHKNYYAPEYFNYLNSDAPKIKIHNFHNQSERQQLFSGCIFNKSSNSVIFKKDWNMCKFILKPENLFMLSSTPHEQMLKQNNEQQVEQNQRLMNKKQQKKSLLDLKRIFPIQNMIDTNQKILLICSINRNEAPFKKCNIFISEVNNKFQQVKSNMKFFLTPTQYYQVYIINKNSLRDQKNFFTYLKLIQYLQKKNQRFGFRCGFQFNIENVTKINHYDIVFRNIDEEEYENMKKLILILILVFIPILIIAICVIFLRRYFYDMLVYYGVIKSRPSFEYPLSALALKIKIRDLKKNKYIKIYQIKKRSLKRIQNQVKSQNSTTTKMENQIQICCFCIQNLENQCSITEIYCKHKMHESCFNQWLKFQPNVNCPLCKRKFNLSDKNKYNLENYHKKILNSSSNLIQQKNNLTTQISSQSNVAIRQFSPLFIIEGQIQFPVNSFENSQD